MTTQEKKGTPAWVWIGCGCAGAIGALVLLVVGLGAWGVNKAREYGEAMSDPEQREERVLEVLGADELPEGYHALVSLSIPFVLDFAMLSDEPFPEDGESARFGDHGYVFVSLPNFGDNDRDLYDFFEGRSDDLDSFGDTNIEIDLRERLGNGRLDRDDDAVLWASHRGTVDPEEVEGAHDGLITLTLFECGDERRRIGIWFGPDPSPTEAADTLEMSGTVADPVELEAFMAPMSPCRS